MRELSIFVDESGDWGEYKHYSPYYIITFVFHDQDVDISSDLSKLDADLNSIGYSCHCLHAGPIIRGEDDYKGVDIINRQRILKKMMGFIRRMDIQYKSFYIEKKQFDDSLDAIGRISKQLALFIRDHLQFFFEFDTIKVYYDNGQTEVSKILSSVLNAFLDNVEFRRVLPRDYRLFQVADFICTLTLVRLKMEHKEMSRSEMIFLKTNGHLRNSI